MLVLSLFPGIGLLDAAFEAEGFTVVRGPDSIWGGDIKRFTPPRGVFDGIIGGPPCQPHSTAGKIIGTISEDLVREFARCVVQGKPKFVVMENVPALSTEFCIDGHDWNRVILRDWDCGGLTSRKRAFWTWPMTLTPPEHREGDPEYSVMKTTWKRGSSKYCDDKGFLKGNYPLEYYAELQGFDIAGLVDAGFSRRTIIHLLGNGVPMAMGRLVARQVREYFKC